MNLIPEIIFYDQALLVVNKPAGLLSIPDGHDPTKPYLRAVLEPQYGRLWIVHRLDKGTSGVLVLARSPEAHSALTMQFAEHRVAKTYQAIVVGQPPWDEEVTDTPLRSNVGRRKRTAVDYQRGKPAITEFRVLERFADHSLIEARPKTGRTHQIRAHLYSLGYPVLADPLYGDAKPAPQIERLALHAQGLTCNHPQSGEKNHFSAPLPPEFQAALTTLREKP
ncbi:MAG: RluA family pseudouridine synthase [Anaerolineales bacterium]|nr:RluA family pseudouridine synthase [Anaerolineales bacterium]